VLLAPELAPGNVDELLLPGNAGELGGAAVAGG
jgi:hypothetical protein